MLDGPCLPARRNLEHIVGHEVAAPVRVGEAAARVVAGPVARLQRQQIVAEIQMHRHAFPMRPSQIGIEQKTLGHVLGFCRILGFGQVLVLFGVGHCGSGD